MAADLVLALNAGSSTVKFALFDVSGSEPALRYRGLIDRLGSVPAMCVRTPERNIVAERRWPEGARQPADFAGEILTWIESRLGGAALSAVAHRIAHGGSNLVDPVVLSAPVMEQLAALEPLAPLHQPHNLAMVRRVQALRPDLVNIGAFDTAFFRDLPPVARCVPLPPPWPERGVRRYGFHGLSYAYLQDRLRALKPLGAPARVVFAHLGSGASLCACRDGRPVETTMGFSPLDGLVMSTRCGAIDPGVLLYLMGPDGLDRDRIEDLLYRRSGLAAVSGLGGDMRGLLDSDAPASRAAVDLFVYRVAQEVGAMAAALGGLDALVFSAGIGEHAPEIRARVCERLAWFGIQLDPEANAASAERITLPRSAVSAWVIPTDEEHTLALGARQAIANDLTCRKADAA
jgi:acetate kinase